MAVDLATAKLHLRIDHGDEDTLIALYLQAAKDHATQFLNRAIYDDDAALAAGVLAGDLTGMVATSAIDAAVLLIAGHLYAHREDVVVGASVAQLPSGANALLWPYRVLIGV